MKKLSVFVLEEAGRRGRPKKNPVNDGKDEQYEKVELVERLTKERDQAVEDARKLLMENKDLKDFLLVKGLVNENYEVIDDE